MTWWQRVLRGKQMEEQLEKELRFHLEQHASDLIARGYDPAEARRQARLALGGPEQVKENCRDARGTRLLTDLLQDLRYAIRTLSQKPAFAVAALLTLALGTGATTVMFTVINGVLLKPLPYADPKKLVILRAHTELYGDQWLPYLNFLDCQRESQSLVPMAGSVYVGGTVTEPGEAEYVDGIQISSNWFSVLGVPLFRGRAFLPEEDRPGGTPVAIVSYSMWQRRFAGSPGAIGARLVFDGKPYTIVGVAPADFRWFGDEVDLFTPIGQNTLPYMRNRRAHPVAVIGRLRSGVNLAQARSEFTLLGKRLADRYPESDASRAIVVDPVRPPVGDVRPTLWLLLGAVSLVLMIACANVASLLLARAVSRERELAMRVALGASRGRLVRQCLTESAVLGVAGGALGVLVAAGGIRPLVRLWPGTLPRSEGVHVDWHVLLFALAASLICGILFGLAPALRAPARDLERTLRAGARSVTGGSRRLHSGFVIAQIALAVVLLVSAGVLGRTLLRLSALDPGIDIRNVLVTRMALSPATLSNPGRIRSAWQDVLDRLRRVPGVESVATVDTVPMRQGNNQLGYSASATLPPLDQQPLALATSVTPGYLQVMGIPLREGRFFQDQDRLGSDPVMVIDDVLAQHAFPGKSPIGQRLWVPDAGPGPFRVVGVVGHVRHWGLASDDRAPVRAQLYYPFAQVPDPLLRRWSELMSIAVRTSIAPLNVVESLRRELRGASNDQVLYEVRTMEQLASDSLARQRFLLLLFAIFAGLALLLACIGIYGVLAYVTSQRVPEIGVRIALGATSRDVIGLVLRQSLGMIFVGVVFGIAAALGTGRVLEHWVPGVRTTEPSTFVVMVSVLVAAALFASFVPARRASRVDPLSALRQE
jgi:predicted permease